MQKVPYLKQGSKLAQQSSIQVQDSIIAKALLTAAKHAYKLCAALKKVQWPRGEVMSTPNICLIIK